MNSTKMESETKILLQILPDLVWEKVLLFLNPKLEFGMFETCSKASGFFDTVIQRFGYLSVVSRGDKILTSSNYPELLGYVPNTTGLCLFPQPILATPQITAMNICMNPNFRPINDYLKWFIISQRDSLKTLHISCLGLKRSTIKLELPVMGKLRDLQIVRNVTSIFTNEPHIIRSLTFAPGTSLRALKNLTLSAFGKDEDWNDFLMRSKGSPEPKYSSCPTVQHLRLLPSRPDYIWQTISRIADKFVFPHLVSLEIPAVYLDWRIYKMFPSPKVLKRLTLTLPTRGLHKHLFDVCITGYGEQVCAALLANPDRDPVKIREEIEKENERRMDDFEECERYRIKYENELRRKGCRSPYLIQFTGLVEIRIKSDTGDWGPTLVSCIDLLSMKSLKTLQFCGHEPKYIPHTMMRKLRQRLAVLTPNFTGAMDSKGIKPHNHKKAVWKQLFGCLSSSFQTVESCSEAEDLTDKAGLLSISRDKVVPSNFGNWLYSPPPPSVPRVLPQIKTFYISIDSNFRPFTYYLNCLLESQRDCLEIFHISCLDTKIDFLEIELPEMSRLRDLQIIRDKKRGKKILKSLYFMKPPVVPRLETLTLSTIGWYEEWEDLLKKPEGSKNPESTCETVKHLRLLPASFAYVSCTYFGVHKYSAFSNLVSLEIPAIHLDLFCTPFLPYPETLKRISLTLPTQGLHKHLFDVSITGYGKQVCAALLATPSSHPENIRVRIEDDNLRRIEDDNLRRIEDDNLRRIEVIECVFEAHRVRRDVFLRRGWRFRFPGITGCSGLEELRIQSDTGDWGPTIVSCPDLLGMKSLKTLQFCGHRPKYIPEDMIKKMKKQFTVLWDGLDNL